MRHRFWTLMMLLVVVLLALVGCVDTAKPTGTAATAMTTDMATQSPVPTATPRQPVVRAVLFWMDTCPHCHEVIEKVLPPLQSKYGDQLQIHMIEVVDEPTWNVLVEIANEYGIPGPHGVPFLVIGDRALMGSFEIPNELPGLIEQHLAAGGLDYPDIPSLQTLLPTEAVDAVCAPETPCADEATTAHATGEPMAAIGPTATPRAAAPASGEPPLAIRQSVSNNGFALAIGILVGMVAAVFFAGVTIMHGPWSIWISRVPDWVAYAVPVLAIVGLAVAAYLAYVETQAVQAVCGPVGDCNAVQSSPYAKLLGIPIGLLGMLGYLAILAAWLLGRGWSDRRAASMPMWVFGMAFFGVLFSIYLTYLEPFVIGAVCIWCLSSAVIMTLILLASLAPALQTLQSREKGEAHAPDQLTERYG